MEGDKIMAQKGFYDQVYDVVARIPPGRVATFGQIARLIGRPKMARFVGYASNNQKSWHLPWHRVVFKDGSLCGPEFFEQQYKALKEEGVKFTKDKRVIMERFQWHPESENMPPDIRDWPLVF
jgi:methylated-DNA-protein-cysteine methyltransferase-like protein